MIEHPVQESPLRPWLLALALGMAFALPMSPAEARLVSPTKTPTQAPAAAASQPQENAEEPPQATAAGEVRSVTGPRTRYKFIRQGGPRTPTTDPAVRPTPTPHAAVILGRAEDRRDVAGDIDTASPAAAPQVGAATSTVPGRREGITILGAGEMPEERPATAQETRRGITVLGSEGKSQQAAETEQEPVAESTAPTEATENQEKPVVIGQEQERPGREQESAAVIVGRKDQQTSTETETSPAHAPERRNTDESADPAAPGHQSTVIVGDESDPRGDRRGRKASTGPGKSQRKKRAPASDDDADLTPHEDDKVFDADEYDEYEFRRRQARDKGY